MDVQQPACHDPQIRAGWRRLVVGAYEVREGGEALLGTTCSEPFMVVRNNDNTEGASYSPIQIPVKHSWAGWGAGFMEVRRQPCHWKSMEACEARREQTAEEQGVAHQCRSET